ncbi:MAG: hypothetical protein WC449_00700 [Candidatus Paceibacterota bacterium]
MNYKNILLAGLLVVSLAGAVAASAATNFGLFKGNGKLGCNCAQGQCKNGNCTFGCKGDCAKKGVCNCAKDCKGGCKGSCQNQIASSSNPLPQKGCGCNKK